MLSIQYILPLIVFCFSTSITPGPNNLMIMLSGINFGLKKSMPHYLGILFGFSAMVILVGVGLGEVFERFPILHTIIKYIGAVYMLYLALQTIRSDPHLKDVASSSKPLTFIQAILFQWVNPKAWVMAIGVVATYTLQNMGILNQILTISLVYFLVGVPCVGTWMISGIALSRFLRNPSHMRKFNWAMGLLLALSIITMLFE